MVGHTQTQIEQLSKQPIIVCKLVPWPPSLYSSIYTDPLTHACAYTHWVNSPLSSANWYCDPHPSIPQLTHTYTHACAYTHWEYDRFVGASKLDELLL
jgi:hypothetical protein